MDFIQKRIARFDAFQRKHPLVGFPYAVIKKYGDDEAGKQAALLAYYGFLSLFPLLLVLTTSLKLFLQNDSKLQQQILADVTNYFPAVLGDTLQPSQGLKGAGIALVVGVLLTLFGARGVADIFRGAMNHVWQVPVVKRGGFPMAIIRSLIIMLVGGFGLIAAPILSGYAVGFGHNIVFTLVGLLLTIVILFAVFLIVARLALSVSRPVRDLWVGCLFAAVGLTFLQSVGGLIITSHLKSLNSLYATFAVALGLLYWLYLQTQVILYAMEIDSVRALKLYPRSVDQKNLTPEDRAAFRLYAHRNRFHDEEEIDVRTKSKEKRPILERLRHIAEDAKENTD
jgi:YihY family inner membrane protein